MVLRVRVVIITVLASACLALFATTNYPAQHWPMFLIYLAAVLLSSGMKVSLLKSDARMSVSFPFILLAVLELSPAQAMIIAAVSVLSQSKFQARTFFSLVQVAFNVANAVNATASCYLTYVLLRHVHLAAAPALTVGATVYFFTNTAPVAVVVAWTSGRKALDLWKTTFAWFLPFYLIGAALAALAHFLSSHYGAPTAALVLPAAYAIYRSYNAQLARTRDREQHIADMGALHLRTIESLAMAIEAKDQDTHDHLIRVRVYVTELGKALQLSDGEMEAVRTAALLHDIGKLAVPERIINKPGKLTQEEFEKMKIHPVVGADILQRVHFPYPVVPIVRAHHEWWNGMGYPDGLRGEAIPIGARILSAVDSFDALASDRPYRSAMPLVDAMAMISKLSGTQFDPRVIEVLEQKYVALEEQARLEGEKMIRLETEIHVSRGLAPGAGFEQDSKAVEATRGQSADASSESSAEGLSPTASDRLIGELRAQVQGILHLREAPGSTLTLEDRLALLISRIAPLIPFDHAILYCKVEGELLSGGLQNHTRAFFNADPVLFGQGLSGWTALHEHSIVNGNPKVEPNYLAQPDPSRDLLSALSLPLREQTGALFGVLSLYAAAANAFSRSHLGALEALELTFTQVFAHARSPSSSSSSKVEPSTPLPHRVAASRQSERSSPTPLASV